MIMFSKNRVREIRAMIILFASITKTAKTSRLKRS